MQRAAINVFVSAGAARMYRERYPEARITVIENGYDEESFRALDDSNATKPLVPGATTLLHSGVVYPSERDPTQFFQALRRMLDDGTLRPGELRVRLRASAHEASLRKLIATFRIDSVVELSPPIAYRDALQEMMRADGLLVLQASNCNEQVPAKLYEYLRCRRPVLGLTDPTGDTAAVLRQAGLRNIAPLDAHEEIAAALRRFLDQMKSGNAPLPDDAVVSNASRLSRARELAGVLDRLPAFGERYQR
jgi:glycosyltransferase involved in cell wall biosynthesis